MDIIITDKRKEEILKSDLAKREHKCATGVFSIEGIISTISKIDFDYLIIEEGTIENFYETDVWVKLCDKVNPEKIYVLLEAETMQTNQILLGTIINLGIYNFESSPSKLLTLMKKPNALADVSRYREMVMFRHRQTKAEYDNTLLVDEEETNRRVREYAEKNGIEFRSRVKNYNNYTFKIVYGLIVLPLLSICLGLLLFVCFKDFAIPFSAKNSYLSKYMTYNLYRNIITPLNMIIFVICCVIMILVNKFIAPFIKVRQTTYQKMFLLPCCLVMTFGASIFYLAGGLNCFIPLSYSHMSLLNICIFLGMSFVSLDYILHLLFLKMTTIEFEKDVKNYYKGFEKISLFVLTIFHVMNFIYLLFIYDTDITKIGKIFQKAMPVLSIFLIIVTLVSIVLTSKEDQQKKEG